MIFYYYADHYINFKDLITELYRIYKTRIWLSAINPASFSQHALGQPPSGIGPGAITEYHSNNTYTMMYGPDPDPYGAVPPYQIGYETYTPNYPGIPGVANSFAPNMAMPGGYQPYASGSGNATPSVPPGVTPTGTAADYNYYYDRSGNINQNGQGQFEMASSSTGPPLSPFYRPGYAAPTMPTVPSERNSAGFAYQGFNRAPQTPGASNATGGFGGQGGLQAPIGTRPQSKDSTLQTVTSTTIPGGGNTGYTGDLQQRGPRLAPDFVPGQQRAPQTAQMPTFLSGVRNVPQSYLQGGNRARPGGTTAAEDANAAEVMRNYLKGLQITDDKTAEKKSRER